MAPLAGLRQRPPSASQVLTEGVRVLTGWPRAVPTPPREPGWVCAAWAGAAHVREGSARLLSFSRVSQVRSCAETTDSDD